MALIAVAGAGLFLAVAVVAPRPDGTEPVPPDASAVDADEAWRLWRRFAEERWRSPAVVEPESLSGFSWRRGPVRERLVAGAPAGVVLDPYADWDEVPTLHLQRCGWLLPWYTRALHLRGEHGERRVGSSRWIHPVPLAGELAAMATGIFVLLLGVRTARDRRRVCLGLCPMCKYPRSTSDTCAECGYVHGVPVGSADR